MNALDKVISIISPKKGAERIAYRNAISELTGNYDVGNSSRLNANWRVVNESGEFTDRASRNIVRARARDLERNSDIMSANINAFIRNIIGKGRMIQAQTDNDDINKTIEKLWKTWCKARNCDVSGQQSFNQILRTAVRRKIVDGGVLFVKRYTKNGIVPFQLQMLEVDELDETRTIPKYKNNKVVGGIEYNSYNRPVGYYFRKYSLDGIEIIGDSEFIKADDVIFYYSKKRFSQIREMPEMTSTMKRIRDTNEFMTAVSLKERIQACFSVFIKKQLPQTAGIGRNNNQHTERESYQGKMLSPGMIKELNAGDEVQVVNPTGQAADAVSFIKLNQRLIGAGNGLSYEATSRDMSQSNYSSARQGIIEDSETFAEDNELIESVMDEIYETFFISCVLSGKIIIKDFWNKKEKYFEHNWVKIPKPWIDPVKESSANKTAYDIGQKTFKDLAAESGKDWRRAIDDMAEVNEYAISKCVLLGGDKNGNRNNVVKKE
ncbi:MAG: phage portal protein [Ruminococcus sp.]